MQHSIFSVWRKLHILAMLSVTEHWQLTELHIARVVGEACCAEKGTRGSLTVLLLTNMEINETGPITIDKFLQLFLINIKKNSVNVCQNM